MEKVYVIIAENGEHGLWSVTSYSTLDKAKNNLNDVTERVAKELGVCEYHGTKPLIEIYSESGFVTNGSSNISIEIHKTVLNSNKSVVLF